MHSAKIYWLHKPFLHLNSFTISKVYSSQSFPLISLHGNKVGLIWSCSEWWGINTLFTLSGCWEDNCHSKTWSSQLKFPVQWNNTNCKSCWSNWNLFQINPKSPFLLATTIVIDYTNHKSSECGGSSFIQNHFSY